MMSSDNNQTILSDKDTFNWKKFPLEYPSISILIVTENINIVQDIIKLFPTGLINSNINIRYPDDTKINMIEKLIEIKSGKSLLLDLNNFYPKTIDKYIV